jgi:hypothetical protein
MPQAARPGTKDRPRASRTPPRPARNRNRPLARKRPCCRFPARAVRLRRYGSVERRVELTDALDIELERIPCAADTLEELEHLRLPWDSPPCGSVLGDVHSTSSSISASSPGMSPRPNALYACSTRRAFAPISGSPRCSPDSLTGQGSFALLDVSDRSRGRMQPLREVAPSRTFNAFSARSRTLPAPTLQRSTLTSSTLVACALVVGLPIRFCYLPYVSSARRKRRRRWSRPPARSSTVRPARRST